jgi:O-acetylserine/cysteine efflux transporter
MRIPLPPARSAGAGPWVAFSSCCLIWGSSFLFIRIANESLAPVWAACLRLAVASALLVPLALALRRPWPRGAELRAAVWFGVVDFGVSLPLLNWGQRQVPSAVAGVCFATIPLSTVLFARAFGLERLRARQVLAAVVALAGVFVLSAGPRQIGDGALSFAAVLGAALAAAMSGVLLKRAPDSDPIAMNAVAHLVGLAACLALSAIAGERPAWPTGTGIQSTLYLGLVGSIGAFVCFAWLVRRWPVSRTAYITVVVPVVAIALGWSVRGEPLTPMMLAGSAIVIAAVVLGIAGDRAAAG